MNHPDNGIPVTKYRADTNPDGQHANHPKYDAYVETRLDEIQDFLEMEYGNLANVPFSVACEKLRELSEYLKNVITSNPNTKINALF